MESKAISDLASRGGRARARSLSKEQKSEIGKRAIEARWGKNLPQTNHTGEIELRSVGGVVSLPCAVLPNSQRVLTQSAFLIAIGRSRTPKAGTGVLSHVDGLPSFLQADALKPFITQELMASTTPIFFKDKSGRRFVGFDAELLPKVAEVYLRLRDDYVTNKKTIPPQYEKIITVCDIVVRGLAQVGIIALIDEATGYQYERPRRDLQEYLKLFLAEGLVRYARTFPNDYFKHLCRLKGIELRTDMKLPQYFGHLTNDLVYRRIAPGLLRRLKERRLERGKPSDKLYGWTSEDLGHPSLLLHLGTVVGLMKINTDYDTFHGQLDRVSPVYPEAPGLFDDPADWEDKQLAT
ncbi:MAG TPA: P63C domain-containing protein [Phycisphaerae bacterium]|nr:P63C domain-containing protein [Phycisphaerae bacterium]